jgi:hypothetical protein
MKASRSVSRLFISVFALCASCALAETSTDIIVESVTDYGPGDQLPNAIPNGDGFAQGMLFPGSRSTAGARHTNSAVYDTDFVDPARDPRGNGQRRVSIETAFGREDGPHRYPSLFSFRRRYV